MVHWPTNSTVMIEELISLVLIGNTRGALAGARVIERGLCSGELQIDPMAFASARLGAANLTKKHPSLRMVSASLNKIADKHYPDH